MPAKSQEIRIALQYLPINYSASSMLNLFFESKVKMSMTSPVFTVMTCGVKPIPGAPANKVHQISKGSMQTCKISAAKYCFTNIKIAIDVIKIWVIKQKQNELGKCTKKDWTVKDSHRLTHINLVVWSWNLMHLKYLIELKNNFLNWNFPLRHDYKILFWSYWCFRSLRINSDIIKYIFSQHGTLLSIILLKISIVREFNLLKPFFPKKAVDQFANWKKTRNKSLDNLPIKRKRICTSKLKSVIYYNQT